MINKITNRLWSKILSRRRILDKEVLQDGDKKYLYFISEDGDVFRVPIATTYEKTLSNVKDKLGDSFQEKIEKKSKDIVNGSDRLNISEKVEKKKLDKEISHSNEKSIKKVQKKNITYDYRKNYNSVRGIAHVDNKIPCQDKTYYLKNDNLHIMVLADGAGSAKLSHFGAKIVTKVIANYINESFHYLHENFERNSIKKDIIDLIIKEVNRLGSKKNSLSDYASTLLFVATYKDKYISGHLGDGAIGFKSDKKIRLLSSPENGETANSTFFYTSKDAASRLRLKKGTISKDSTFILMSDGTYDCIYDKQNQKFTNAIYSFVEWTKQEDEKKVSTAILKNIKNYFTEKTTDDISLSILDINVSK